MEKLFDIGNRNLGNEPTDEEIRFITSYIEKQFSEIENMDFSRKTNEEKNIIFSTICSIKNAIEDLLSPDGGNYHKLLIALNNKVDFESRLSGIIEKFSTYISDENRSEINIDNSSNKVVHNPGYGYKVYELTEYINKLLLIEPLKDEEIESQLKVNTEQIQTLRYLCDYLTHLVVKYSNGQTSPSNQPGSLPLIFFLRDTLLLYLGAKWLQAKGVSIDARAALINRRLIHSFSSSKEENFIYKKSYNLVFHVLSVYQGRFSKGFIERYKELFRIRMTQPEIQLLKFLDEYLAVILGNRNDFVAVDTAAHGTMPLLAHGATGRLSSLEMFTSKPWLYEFYSSNIFKGNFPNMRALESLVCQEELFQFAYISQGKIYINETCDPMVLSKAKLEIGIFLNIIDKTYL